MILVYHFNSSREVFTCNIPYPEILSRLSWLTLENQPVNDVSLLLDKFNDSNCGSYVRESGSSSSPKLDKFSFLAPALITLSILNLASRYCGLGDMLPFVDLWRVVVILFVEQSEDWRPQQTRQVKVTRVWLRVAATSRKISRRVEMAHSYYVFP